MLGGRKGENICHAGRQFRRIGLVRLGLVALVKDALGDGFKQGLRKRDGSLRVVITVSERPTPDRMTLLVLQQIRAP
ncbi:MAG: hypothetical protein OXC91_03015 [Rhodobacteraceae bacterium]|nr:hypothetical protein [Paracoccaceae bacterium]